VIINCACGRPVAELRATAATHELAFAAALRALMPKCLACDGLACKACLAYECPALTGSRVACACTCHEASGQTVGQ
jgi:hypothetical protein